jgi:Holliday junction resolvase RusA-like endonuclease
MGLHLSFFIPGLPQPGGSKRAFMKKGMKFPVVVDDNPKAADWKRTVSHFAHTIRPSVPSSAPLAVDFTFVMPRPASHFGSGRNAGILKASAPAFPTKKPDCTKLIRSTEDALTGIMWVDDAQIVDQHGRKVFGDQIGAHITVKELT